MILKLPVLSTELVELFVATVSSLDHYNWYFRSYSGRITPEGYEGAVFPK